MLTSSGGGGGRSMLTGGRGGDKICQNLADVICERSLIENSYSNSSFDKIYCIANVIFLITMGSSSTILNVLALKFFMKKISIFNLVFKWTTLTDLATLGASFPVMVSYASYRSPVIFANLSFCAVRHVTWRVITRFAH